MTVSDIEQRLRETSASTEQRIVELRRDLDEIRQRKDERDRRWQEENDAYWARLETLHEELEMLGGDDPDEELKPPF
jgi:hypothetical protein